MAYIRKRLGKWQCVIRVKGKPPTTKTFLIKKDAKLWGKKTELHFFREDNDIQKSDYRITRQKVRENRVPLKFVRSPLSIPYPICDRLQPCRMKNGL